MDLPARLVICLVILRFLIRCKSLGGPEIPDTVFEWGNHLLATDLGGKLHFSGVPLLAASLCLELIEVFTLMEAIKRLLSLDGLAIYLLQSNGQVTLFFGHFIRTFASWAVKPTTLSSMHPAFTFRSPNYNSSDRYLVHDLGLLARFNFV